MADLRKRLLYGGVLTVCVILGIAAYLRWDSAQRSVAPAPQAQQERPETVPQPVQEMGSISGPNWESQQRLDVKVRHRYDVHLRSGQLLHAAVDQDIVAKEAIDIAVDLHGPSGPLFEIDNPTGTSGAEEIYLLADSPGIYQVEVKGSGKTGTYRIRCLSIRQASPADRINAQAEEVFYHARVLRGDQHYSQAVDEYLQAALLWSGLGNKRRQANAYERAADILRDHNDGDVEKARDITERALKLYRSLSDRRAEAKMLVWIGIAHRQLEALEVAEDCYRRAIRIAAERGYREEKAEALMNLGILLNQTGRKSEALDAYEESLDLWRRGGRADNQANVLNYIGQVYASLGKYEPARNSYIQAWEALRTSQKADELRALILTRLAEVFRKTGDTGWALTYTLRALSLLSKLESPRKEAVALAEISLIYKEQGDLRRARDYQEQALAIYRRLNDRRAEATARFNLGLILLDQANVREATRQFERSVALARAQKFREGEVMARYGMALTDSRRGNPRKARAEAEETLKLIEETPRDLPYEGSEEGSESSYLLARMSTYALLVHLLVRSPVSYTPERDKIRSFEISESARWRTLLDSLGSSRIRPELFRHADPALVAEYRKAMEEVRRMEKERGRLESSGPAGDGLLRAEREPMDRLRIAEARLKASWGTSRNRPTPASLDEAQRLLDPATLLLEYFLGNSRSFLWLVSPSSLEVFELPGGAEIEKKALRLHTLLSESQDKANKERADWVAAELSAVLLGPVADRLGEKRLVIVPDGALHYVPFAILPDPVGGKSDSQRAPLLAKHVILYEPSASVLQGIRAEVARRAPAPGLLAIVAEPVFDPEEYASLPYSREEAEKISALIPAGGRKLVKLGYEASRDLVLNGRLKGFRYHHFATHGENHPEQPELSGIVLSQVYPDGRKRNGDVRLQDIKNLDLPSDLVVLSACKTAIGRPMQGEGFVGLTQGFMYAGAARIVVSLWNVNDSSTPAFMERFYRGILEEGLPPAEALRAAQLWMLEETPWQSPYYWAGFTIHGEWRGDLRSFSSSGAISQHKQPGRRGVF